MAVTLTAFATTMRAAVPATVATAIGGGTTSAQVTALANLLTVMAQKPSQVLPLFSISDTAKTEFTTG